MIEKNPIKKMARAILHGKKHMSFDRNIMHPEREWFLGLLVGFIILGAGIFWSIDNRDNFKDISITTTGEAEDNVVYKASLVEAALNDFKVRKENYENLKKDLLSKGEKVEKSIIPVEEIESQDMNGEAGEAEIIPVTEESTSSAIILE